MISRNTLRIITLVLCGALALTVSKGQSTVTGSVKNVNGDPLPLANVALAGTYDGASTDADGNFEFTTDATGRALLQVSYTGYKTHEQQIDLISASQRFVIVLQDDARSLEAITITAGSFTAGDQSTKTIFRAIDIATTAGATADIAGALNTLPGTQRVGESGRLFIRGGDGSEARTFIDGLLVPDAYSPAAPNTPSRGRFLPFMFKGISFSSGGYSAEYGQALSSALVLSSKDKAEMTRTDFGILSVGGDVSRTQVWNRGSLAAKIHYTNLQPYFSLVEQRIDWRNPPISTEVHTAFRQQSGKYGLFKVYINYNDTRFSLYKHGFDTLAAERLDLSQHYSYVNASYKNILNDHWSVRTGFSYGQTQLTTQTSKSAKEKDATIHAKVTLEGSACESVEVKAGAEFIDRSYQPYESFSFNETVSAVFAEADMYISSRLISRVGVRGEHNSTTGRIGAQPRVSLAYKTGSASQGSFAYGNFLQSPGNEYLRINPLLGSGRATHYIVNYQHNENDRTFRVEGYYKKYSELVKFESASKNDANNSGHGFARGFEVFWRDNRSVRNTDYWISYSFLDTERNYLDYPGSATPAFASAHNFSVVFKRFIGQLKSQVGVSYAYTSGRRYHNPNETGFNTGLTPSYQDLSVNWSYLPAPFIIVYLSCTNILGRDNIFGYEFSDKLSPEGLYASRPIRQPASNFLFVGIFITISKEKTVNQLPNL